MGSYQGLFAGKAAKYGFFEIHMVQKEHASVFTARRVLSLLLNLRRCFPMSNVVVVVFVLLVLVVARAKETRATSLVIKSRGKSYNQNL